MTDYEDRKRRLTEQMKAAAGGGQVGLSKDTSNLFRDRGARSSLNVRDFRSVLAVNPAEGWFEAEGMTPYADIVEALLPHGFMPAVVPQLKSITIGGAVVGIGIEATSFRYGLVHETVLEAEVLLSDGRVVLCTRDNEYADLFAALPNSYGSLGYILKLKAKMLPIKPFVRVEHTRFSDPTAFFAAVQEAADTPIDFLDGVVFSGSEMILSRGTFVDEAPSVSDYTWMDIYYKSLRVKDSDHLTAKGYIWRWDTDWFWCSKAFCAGNPLVRLLAGRRWLNSVTYTRIMRFNARWKLTAKLNKLLGIHTEAVIQDIVVPIGRCEEFLSFLLGEIGVLPIWICPTRSPDRQARYPLFPMPPGLLEVDFGFWDIKRGRTPLPRGHYNRKIERKAAELDGRKSLYSESYYPREEFWTLHDKAAYETLKATYDPQGKLKDLYAKCVLSQ